MAIALLSTHTITFTEYGDSVTTGYYDKGGVWVDPVGTVRTFDVLGSLQPYSKDNTRSILPEGVKEESTYVFYSKEEIRVTNKRTNLKGATTVIDSDTYEVGTRAKWQGFSLIPDHYEYVLILQSPDE